MIHQNDDTGDHPNDDTGDTATVTIIGALVSSLQLLDSKLDHVLRRNGTTFSPHFVVLSVLESVQDFPGDYTKPIQRHWSGFGEL